LSGQIFRRQLGFGLERSGGVRVLVGGGVAGGQNRFGLALERQETLHLLFAARLLSAEFEEGSAAKNPCGAGGVLFAGELQHQLVIPHGLQGRFRHAEAIDAALENILDGFQLLLLDVADLAGRQHLQGQLAAATQIKAELQPIARQQSGRGDRESQDEGYPALLACHEGAGVGGESGEGLG
jgi:hypothetical protein